MYKIYIITQKIHSSFRFYISAHINPSNVMPLKKKCCKVDKNSA